MCCSSMAAEVAGGQFSGDDLVLEVSDVRAFRESSELGSGRLTITECELSWKREGHTEEALCLHYPDISVHAVSRDTSSFPFACVYLLTDDGSTPGGEVEDDSEGESEPVEYRLVPSDSDKLDAIFTAISECQELYPDPELSSDSEADPGSEEEGEEPADSALGEGDQLYTSEEGLQHLTAEGQAVLAHLETILRVSNGDNGTNGAPELSQFEDADSNSQ